LLRELGLRSTSGEMSLSGRGESGPPGREDEQLMREGAAVRRGRGVRLGVLGWPVAHSRSPAMHNAALQALRVEGWRYQLLPVPGSLLEQTVAALPGAGFLGANVTIPHKQAALALADEASETAREIGAANTLIFRSDGTSRAENTDAPGLLACLPGRESGESALVLGAGGSGRAAAWALSRAGWRVMVWNRTESRARQMAQQLGVRAVRTPVAADLLVNCTSVGLAGDETEDAALNQIALSADQLRRYRYVADLVYSTQQTPLPAAAARQGAATIDGVEILVRQGALSFELWTGLAPPLDVMRAAARTGWR
jgi:shikimate dehydrogenase